MPGPYDREEQALAEPMPQEVDALHRTGRVKSGDPDWLVRKTVLRHLQVAFEQADVDLGAFDRPVLTWLARWEPAIVQCVLDWVTRAHAAGRRRPETAACDATNLPTDAEIGAYYDQHNAVADAEVGIPADWTARMRPKYIADVRANPETLRQIAEWARARGTQPDEPEEN